MYTKQQSCILYKPSRDHYKGTFRLSDHFPIYGIARVSKESEACNCLFSFSSESNRSKSDLKKCRTEETSAIRGDIILFCNNKKLVLAEILVKTFSDIFHKLNRIK